MSEVLAARVFRAQHGRTPCCQEVVRARRQQHRRRRLVAGGTAAAWSSSASRPGQPPVVTLLGPVRSTSSSSATRSASRGTPTGGCLRSVAVDLPGVTDAAAVGSSVVYLDGDGGVGIVDPRGVRSSSGSRRRGLDGHWARGGQLGGLGCTATGRAPAWSWSVAHRRRGPRDHRGQAGPAWSRRPGPVNTSATTPGSYAWQAAVRG